MCDTYHLATSTPRGEAALAEEVLALVAEEHRVPLVALDADLHLGYSLLLDAHRLLVLALDIEPDIPKGCYTSCL